MKIKIDRFQPTLYLFLCFFFLDIQGADKPLILETKIENIISTREVDAYEIKAKDGVAFFFQEAGIAIGAG